MSDKLPTLEELNKQPSGRILAYDLVTLPAGWTVAKMLRCLQQNKVIFYNSKIDGLGESKSMVAPKWIDGIGSSDINPDDVKIIEISEDPELFIQLTNSCNDSP